MAVNHAVLESHWQSLQNKTNNELFAELCIATKKLLQAFEQRGKANEIFQNFQVIAAPVLEGEVNLLKTGKKESSEEQSSLKQIKAGKELFDVFSHRYRADICSTRGVMGALLKGTVNTEQLPVFIATHVLVTHFSEDSEWNEFASIFAALLHQIGVEEFCSG